MPLIPNPRLIFNEIPAGLPDPQTVFHIDTQSSIDVYTIELNGGFIVKVLSLSMDPYMRNRMRPADTEGDMPALRLGEPVTGFGVGVVLRSEHPGFIEGMHVSGFMPYQQYALFSGASGNGEALVMSALGLIVLENKYHLPWRYFVGPLGMTGQTAYYAFKDLMNPKKGETILISAAAGAVGLLAVQYALSLGLRVITVCGTEEKVRLLQNMGVRHVINRKTTNIIVELAKLEKIDIYLDHVGGEILEAAIENAAMHARFIICGSISSYNAPLSEAYGIRNLWLVNRYRITIRPLVVIDWHEKYMAEFYDVVPTKIARGELKLYESIYKGLEQAGQAFVDMLQGKTTGKTVVHLSDE